MIDYLLRPLVGNKGRIIWSKNEYVLSNLGSRLSGCGDLQNMAWITRRSLRFTTNPRQCHNRLCQLCQLGQANRGVYNNKWRIWHVLWDKNTPIELKYSTVLVRHFNQLVGNNIIVPPKIKAIDREKNPFVPIVGLSGQDAKVMVVLYNAQRDVVYYVKPIPSLFRSCHKNIYGDSCSAQNNQNAMLGHFGRPFSVFDSTEQELYMWQDRH